MYPFIKELKRGNHEAVRGIFSFLAYGQITAEDAVMSIIYDYASHEDRKV
jgi:hypothetical protein